MKKFFTLVELMVVIGIIVILAGILLPTLAGSRDKAAAAKCMSNMKQLASAMTLYSGDNNNYMLGDSDTLSASWVGVLRDYVKENKIFNCEADENEDEVTIESNVKFLVSYYANRHVIRKEAWKKVYAVEKTTATVSIGPRPGTTTVLGSTTAPTSDLKRHGKTSNYLFVDGHAESIQKDAFEQKKATYWSAGN